jgi:hypothetical protein
MEGTEAGIVARLGTHESDVKCRPGNLKKSFVDLGIQKIATLKLILEK